MNLYSLVLASQSPRRKELLSYLNIPFEVCVSSVNEESEEKSPQQFCEVIAQKKGEAVFSELKKRMNWDKSFFPFVISSDTIVFANEKIYGKPSNVDEARNFLLELSGRSHTVYTAVHFCYLDKKELKEKTHTFSCASQVSFDIITPEVLEQYLKTKDSLDKAGAYGIQGPSLTFISHLEGSYSNVVGFPLSHVVSHLRECLKTKNLSSEFNT
jgi:septum formation protein